MRHVLTPIAAALVLVAQPAFAAADLHGTWALDPVASDDVEKAIGQAVDKVNFVIRGFASSRLKSTNQPYKTVAITTKGAEMSIKTDDRQAITGPSNGTSFKWKRDDGQVYNLTFVWKGETRLEQTFANDEGKRVNVYQLDGAGMKMAVTVSSGKLPVPLTYTLAYKRK